jgi:N-glycosylase/DNA lyase
MSYSEICNFEGIIINPVELFFIKSSEEPILIQKSIRRNMKKIKLEEEILLENKKNKIREYKSIISEEVSFLLKRNFKKGIVYDVNAYKQYLLKRLSNLDIN